MTAVASDRIAVVDVLRAVALFGILITHAEMGFLAGPPPDPMFDIFGPLDRFAAETVRVLAAGKFFSIFSFLFGLSFTIQLQRAARKGSTFSARFAWRLLILLMIGSVHNLFFSGDILIVYALLGLLLIPMNAMSTKVLAIFAIVLVFNVPQLGSTVASLNDPPPPATQQQAQGQRAAFRQNAQRQLEIKQSGTLSELVNMNATQSFSGKLSFQIASGRLWITFGFFLLGMCAGRVGIFEPTDQNRKFFRGLLVWAGAPAAISTVLAIMYPSVPVLRGPADVLPYTISSVQQVTLAAFYVALVSLAFWRRPSGLLADLAPMGKMGLTTYLMQTVFGLLVFYGIGLGLLGKVGTATCIAIGTAFFVLQFYFARWWMSRYSLGPIEWLWRSLTWMKVQPNPRPVLKAA